MKPSVNTMKIGSRLVLAAVIAVVGLVSAAEPGDEPRAGKPGSGPSLERPGGEGVDLAAVRRLQRGEMTAYALDAAAQRAAEAEFWIELARCLNDPGANLGDCVDDGLADIDEARDAAKLQLDARLAACQLVGSAPYDPAISPPDFSSSVTNIYHPLVPGRTLEYRRVTAGGVEEIEVTTLNDTIDVDGITCRIVDVVERKNGVLVEHTFDYFAQRSDGTVWYFGELSRSFDEDGMLESLEGSWRTGREGAKPGIAMLAAPAVGAAYRKEFVPPEAEDVARVVSLGNTITTPVGTFSNCVETEDTAPNEPEERESKFFAPHVGLVREVNEAGEVLELTRIRNH